MRFTILFLALVIAALPAGTAPADDAINVLFLTKSSTFVHSSIRRSGDELGHAEKVLTNLGSANGLTVRATKDAGEINAENLKKYDAVVFYTTGDLTVSGSGTGIFGGDQEPPMGPNGVEDLRAWVQAGGGFLAYHCGADTLHSQGDTISPYIDMLGGEFVVHGKQFVGSVTVVDPAHPAMTRFPNGWTHLEEWYTFKNYAVDSIRVLALLETDPERPKQPMYDVDAYPITWCRAFGEGRVFYNAIGHREDIWDNPDYQNSVVDAIRWASGTGETAAEPNFNEAVGTTD